MKAKVTLALLLLLAAAMLAGCGVMNTEPTVLPTEDGPAETAALPEDTTGAEPVQETAVTEASSPEETESPPVPVETPYGTLYYQARWEGTMLTQQTQTGDALCVSFLAELEGVQYPLFSVTIGGAEANAGSIADSEGTLRNVFAAMEELGDLSALTDAQRDILYAMQEEINFVVNKIN